MEEEQDQRQFFKDLGATAEQTVQEARGVEEDYFVLLQRMLIAFPWVADITAKLQNYANQNFVIALDFSRELSQAKDIQDFARINVEFAQKSFKTAGEQAEDFAEACTAWQRRQLKQLTFCPS
jgi:Phasin protein